ncbi:uncharacterized protein LOC111448524 isoform X1 [Cucurbita moschata]|uniref:Uncharacterized protein LOC111448524 isoform X1 n=1 Tax=Cucurbita moschata TaxID=3662 RepID=A0A6J1FT40_CUCMO|nr:uncharacterized protein LOC111448524 isoform X1 [Cucurbita moschata]
MAKRELSNTLRNLKFMQRAGQREDQPKREEEVKPDENFFPSSTIIRKCVVLVEGDPHPGAFKGRMSFQSFNPSIDRLNEEIASLGQHEIPGSSSGNHSGNLSSRQKILFPRDNGSSQNEASCSNIDEKNCEANEDLKRKQSEVVSDGRHPTKFPRSGRDNQQSSFSHGKGPSKKPKGEKLDWNVLRPSKTPNKSG